MGNKGFRDGIFRNSTEAAFRAGLSKVFLISSFFIFHFWNIPSLSTGFTALIMGFSFFGNTFFLVRLLAGPAAAFLFLRVGTGFLAEPLFFFLDFAVAMEGVSSLFRESEANFLC